MDAGIREHTLPKQRRVRRGNTAGLRDLALDAIPDSIPIQDAIYGRLKRALMVGHFAPGHAYTIRSLARAFDFSMMPIRSALVRLVAESALVLTPARSVCVPLMSRARFQEIVDLRLLLEPKATRKAALFATPETMAQLIADNARMQAARKAGDVVGFLEANWSFHFRIYALAGCPVTMPIIESLWMQVGATLRWVFTEKGSRVAGDNHDAILRALRRNDPDGTSAGVANDIAEAADNILMRYPFAESD
jgi:DNA-binding GntR family transcriptional regulator